LPKPDRQNQTDSAEINHLKPAEIRAFKETGRNSPRAARPASICQVNDYTSTIERTDPARRSQKILPIPTNTPTKHPSKAQTGISAPYFIHARRIDQSHGPRCYHAIHLFGNNPSAPF
jgi:hypothetical protein